VTAAERSARTASADALCRAALEKALDGGDDTGVALVAVGGYGRAELAPHSDLDVVLVHADDLDVGEVAGRVWYPLWDAGVDLDHSVRALSEVQEVAAADPRVALGLLDARHVAGDANLALVLRTGLLARWRRDARSRLPELHRLVSARAERLGELAHAAVPDLKESTGGLRDATVLKALVASWLVDVPHGELERSRQGLLDVRDVLHEVTGRATDRIAPELWPELAERLGRTDAESLQRHVRGLGRRVTHLSRLTWRRVDAVLARPPATGRRAPALTRIAPGVALSGDEVVLDRGARVEHDPTLLLRAAAEAAERDLVLAPATAARLARQGAVPPEPWDEETRNLFVRLVAAGPGLLPVWETLDETGALDRLLPEWERVRLLPHASAVHRFTVDRHLVETCVEASRLIRRVARPDVLMTAALLHDIGKGGAQDHSVAGEPVAAAAAARMGFPERECGRVGHLVRRHLLLPETATTRDLADPATVEQVSALVGDVETLDLLAVLTEADARATGPQAWTSWRAALVADLVARVRSALLGLPHAAAPGEDAATEVPVPSTVRSGDRRVEVHVEPAATGTSVTVVSRDRLGLMAAVAGAFAVLRLSVRAARAWPQDDFAVSAWDVADPDVDPAILRQRLDAVLDGVLDPGRRLAPPRPGAQPPAVQVRHEASARSTVLEVRVDDRPGVVYLVCRALADMEVTVRSAHVSTLGPQAVDVFYLQEPGAGALGEERAASAVHAVRRALGDTVTLDP
jgi:[protein-PII] uridylyltransferase